MHESKRGGAVTEKQIEQYEIRYKIDGQICQKCGTPLKGLGDGMGHRIARTKTNYKIHGAHIIDHNCNLVPACIKCNDHYNIGFKIKRCDLLVKLIEKFPNAVFTTREINDYIGFGYE